VNPDPNPTWTHDPRPADAPTGTFDPALDAGLAAAFGPEATPGGWSQPPLLRDDPSENAPLVQPSSAEMPRGGNDRYQIFGEIAHGGMGVVLKGRDPDLGRELAFKVLKAELAGRPAAVQRFVEEAQVGGQLQHPGVVPIYDLGRFADGRPYFAMKLVKGRTLADLLAEREDPSADRGRFLQIFSRVCETVAYTHSRGVIHRDLKPSNVMVGAFGEVLVMDWGLAKVLPRGGVADELKASGRREPAVSQEPTVIHTARSGSGGGSDTLAGSVMGTPAFMPPEQAGGEIDKLDERADVFGLGAVLCVVLTGQPPYVANTGEAVRLMAVRGDLEDAFARLDSCGADAELAELCKRCLAPKRDARLRHAGEVAGVMTAYLAAVEARAHRAEVERAAAAAEAKEQRKRRRVQAALGVALTAVVALVGFGLWWQERQSTAAAADRASRQARTAASISTALEDTRSRIAETWAIIDDPDRVQVAADSVRAALRRSEGFADTGDPTQDALAELTAVRAAVEDMDRHVQLVTEVARNKQRFADEIDGGSNSRKAPAVHANRQGEAVRKFGLDPLNAAEDDVARTIAASRLRDTLLGTLAEWQLHAADPGVKQRLGQVIRATRLACGGVYARWQYVLDGNDAQELIGFSTSPEVLGFPPQLLGALGRDLLAARQPDAARHLLRTAVERYPLDPWLHFDLAAACSSARPPNSQEALRHMAAASALQPNSTRFLRGLGMIYADLGAFDQAIDAVNKAIAVRPDSGVPHLYLGKVLARKRDPDAAIASFREALRLDPGLSVAHLELGLVQKSRGDLRGAITSFREAVRLDPQDAEAHYFLGANLSDDPDAAVASLRKAISLNPMFGDAHFALGIVLTAKNDVEGAAAAYREAIRLNPGSPEAYCNLGLLLHRSGRHVEAIGFLRRGHELGSRQRGWRYPSATWVADCERQIAEKGMIAPPPREVNR
jgi:serine/threonine-protein kinase